jgi:hypothetical protein
MKQGAITAPVTGAVAARLRSGCPAYLPFRFTSASDFFRTASNSSPGFQVGIFGVLATTRPV